jgi:hypothetical protein
VAGADAAEAVRATFATYLTGPSLAVTPLTAKLAAQVREEGRAADCRFLLLTTVKHVRKGSGGGLLERMAGAAAQQAAWSAGSSVSSAAGRVVVGAAAGAAGVAAYSYATAVQVKDELTVRARLETETGVVLVELKEMKKAMANGEDLVTPLVAKEAEAIAAAVSNHKP